MRRPLVPAILWVAAASCVLAPAATTPAHAECAGVIITEIMYNPSTAQGSDTTDEWVEIRNDGCERVDLTGWTISDNASTDPILRPDGAPPILEPGQYALIIDGEGSTVTSNPVWGIAPGTQIFLTDDASIGSGLTNTGDTLTLRDASASVVDTVTYDDTDASGCGAEANGQGWSLERVDPLGPGDCTNFRSDELRDAYPMGGTPGSDNYLWIGSSCFCAMVDNYKCYRAVGPFDPVVVNLTDRFGQSEALVRRIDSFCGPASKDGGSIMDGQTHLTCYKIDELPELGGASLPVINGFGSEIVQVGGASRLCVPSLVLPDGRPIDGDPTDGQTPPLDHFKCYQARNWDFDDQAVFLEDGYYSENVLLTDTSALCTPVDKNGEGILDPVPLLECHRAVASGLPNLEVVLLNQFGVQEIKLRETTGVCVPALQSER